MWWAIFQSFLPMFTGGYADRYGYKRTLAFSVTLNIIGYLLMAYFHSYYGFFAGIICLAIGTAFFKPSLQGTLAHQLTKATSSLGWGIFYWIVNVGSVIGHYISPLLLGQPHSIEGWKTVFIFCAGCTAMNYLMLFTFRDVPSGASKRDTPLQVLHRTFANILEPRLIIWLLIMSCFWLMMYQLWDLQPNFIEDWIDSSMVAAHMPFDSWREMGDRGLERVPQQVLISLNALLIVCLMVPVSWLVRKMRTLSAMLIGMLVATGGVLVAGMTGNGWVLLLGILFFSLGEMLTGPKKNEYLGLIAPPGKKGLYLGYVNIPIGVGVGLGSFIAGHVYGAYGEKATLALNEMSTRPALIARAARTSDWSDSLEKLPPLLGVDRDAAFDQAADAMGTDLVSAARALTEAFQYDKGQIDNLALQYLALNAKKPTDVAEALGKALAESADEGRVELGKDLVAGKTKLAEVGVARCVDLLPQAIDTKRVVAFDKVCAETGKQQADVITMLWLAYRDDPDVLNNLGLEYLAQGTDKVEVAVAAIDFTKEFDTAKKRREEISQRIGIGRTKAFAALAAAMGAEAAEVDAALAPLEVPDAQPGDKAYVYLINNAYQRHVAVARKNWFDDMDLLRRLIRNDDPAREVVLDGIDKETVGEKVWNGIKSIFTSDDGKEAIVEDGINYTRLAAKPDLIQAALDVKDWSRAPREAAALLLLNPYEARALVAADVNQSARAATDQLWAKYHPQYKVWIPFASIGVVAAIALGIFGQLAKRWKDMNA
jgi:MFS family permease